MILWFFWFGLQFCLLPISDDDRSGMIIAELVFGVNTSGKAGAQIPHPPPGGDNAVCR
jgi:hypothetical protein